ncbi:MAG: M55 family metallopeptidase, partial [Anaerolineae bacterium]
MEGISGIVDGSHTDPSHKEYERGRKFMTGDVNAAVEGALAGGATEVVVNDSHWTMHNILIEELHEAAQLISGAPKPFSMMQGLDDSFDAVFLIGYHAQAGTAEAILDHSYTGFVHQISLNGQPLGEPGFNAALAGYYGVPVVLVSGDRAMVEEARRLFAPAESVVVKEACGRSAAKCLPLKTARNRIREAAARALEKGGKPFVFEPPITLTIRFSKSSQADMAQLVPGARRLDGYSLEFTDDDLPTIYKARGAMISLAGLER